MACKWPTLNLKKQNNKLFRLQYSCQCYSELLQSFQLIIQNIQLTSTDSGRPCTPSVFSAFQCVLASLFCRKDKTDRWTDGPRKGKGRDEDGQTDGQTETERQTHRETDRWRDKQVAHKKDEHTTSKR